MCKLQCSWIPYNKIEVKKRYKEKTKVRPLSNAAFTLIYMLIVSILLVNKEYINGLICI